MQTLQIMSFQELLNLAAKEGTGLNKERERKVNFEEKEREGEGEREGEREGGRREGEICRGGKEKYERRKMKDSSHNKEHKTGLKRV